ncbi:hypothetical protein D1B33_04800 [Lysinibacillus yapensis]|uniref:Uncharacterized protein n=1 Tax=Ureibacillus yapensis TaxID=2304605 RepID=A0A396SB07_9BACL|nr:hypothetical protein [Lysinibacillus yapensis]RHW38210.1 hypothetical protein D1B33_04800 [Lysinibacillus yapensis]
MDEKRFMELVEQGAEVIKIGMDQIKEKNKVRMVVDKERYKPVLENAEYEISRNETFKILNEVFPVNDLKASYFKQMDKDILEYIANSDLITSIAEMMENINEHGKPYNDQEKESYEEFLKVFLDKSKRCIKFVKKIT